MKAYWIFSLLVILLFAFPPQSYGKNGKDVAVILKTKGQVRLARPGARQVENARRGARLNNGNILRTGEKSLAALVFTDDKSLLKIRSNSKVTVKGKREEKSIFKTLSLEFGQLWAKVTRSVSPFRIETPSGVAAVKGTQFYCIYNRDGTMMIFCIEGIVELSNRFGTVMVNAGETGIASKQQGPITRPSKAVEVPGWGGDDGEQMIEIEFENDSGEKKKLKLRYE